MADSSRVLRLPWSTFIQILLFLPHVTAHSDMFSMYNSTQANAAQSVGKPSFTRLTSNLIISPSSVLEELS